MKRGSILVFALIPALVWGVSFVATKYAVSVIPPFTLGFVRFVISYAVLRGVLMLGENRKKESVKREDRTTLMLLGLLGITFYFVFENFGLLYTSASNSALIISTIPIFTLIYERLSGSKHVSKRAVSGIVLGFAGLYFLINGFSLRIDINFKGDIMMFFSVFSWLAYTAVSKRIKNRYSSIVITADMSLYGALFFIPFVAWEAASGRVTDPQSIVPAVWISVLYLGVVCSAAAYILWNKALSEFESGKVNSFIYIIPVFTIAAEAIIHKSLPSPKILFASAMIIAGLFLANSEKTTKM